MLEKRTSLIVALLVSVLVAGTLVACGPGGDRPTLVFFRANNCPYCKQMTPVVDDIEKEYGSQLTVVYATVNEPDGKQLAQQHGIIGYPTILLLSSEGEQAGLLRGVIPRSSLEKMVDELLAVEQH